MAEHTHDDVRFLEFAERMQRFPDGQRVLHLHLSELRPHNKHDHHFRVVTSLMDGLHQKYDGYTFRMHNDDLFVTFKDGNVDEIEVQIDKIRKLFEEDPLIVAENRPPRPGERRREVCTWYQGAQDQTTILRIAKAAREDGDAARQENPQIVIGNQRRQSASEPMGPNELARLEDAIERANLANVATRQFICAIMEDDLIRPVMNELFISIAMLQSQIMPDVKISANRWLFQHLTEALDKRVLQVLLGWKPEQRIPVNVNINVATLLSEEFLKFDQDYAQRGGQPLIFELQAMDIFADWGAFRFARDLVHERGHSVALDGLNYMALPAFNRDYVGMDLYKLAWSPEMAGDLSDKQNDLISKAIEEIGPNRVVLSRCDNSTAVQWGRKMSITLFQGRYPDQLLRKNGPKDKRRR